VITHLSPNVEDPQAGRGTVGRVVLLALGARAAAAHTFQSTSPMARALGSSVSPCSRSACSATRRIWRSSVFMVMPRLSARWGRMLRKSNAADAYNFVVGTGLSGGEERGCSAVSALA
jgi:hypothetical protein